MIVDAHQHFWALSRGDYAWLTPDLDPIRRDFTPPDLTPLLEATGIERTVLVQAAPTLAETRFLLELAAGQSSIGAVVGWVDFEADGAAQDLEHFARHPKFRGVRPMVHDIADSDWLSHPELDPLFDHLAQMGLTFDALVTPRELPSLLARVSRTPKLRVAVDHAAKPDIARGELRAWRTLIAQFKSCAQVVCKLSGLRTEAGERTGDDDLRPVVEVLFDTFGPHRIMWGSDWPVLNLAGTYEEWWQQSHRLCDTLPPVAKSLVFGGTACRFYSIESPT